jgi:hypothetical protein
MLTTRNTITLDNGYALIDVRNNVYKPVYASCSLDDLSTVEQYRWVARGDLGPFTTIREGGIDYPIHMANVLLNLDRKDKPRFMTTNVYDCRRENFFIKIKQPMQQIAVNSFSFVDDYAVMHGYMKKDRFVILDLEDVERVRPYYWTIVNDSGKWRVNWQKWENGKYISTTNLLTLLMNWKHTGRGRNRVKFKNGDTRDYRKSNIILTN